MRVALYQTTSPAGDIPAGFEALELALQGAADAGVDMLVLPELFLPGYNAVIEVAPEGWMEVLPRISAMCKAHGVALSLGLSEYAGGTVYNSAYAIGCDGEILARYRKVQLWGPREHALFTPGEQLITFDYLGTRFGLVICYDVEFPEHIRALANAGVTVVLCPTANMAPFINVCTIQVPGRALESGITIVYANYTGSEGDLDYVGHSVIAGPDGYPLAAKGMGEGLLSADIPSGLLENDIPFSTQLADYRPMKVRS